MKFSSLIQILIYLALFPLTAAQAVEEDLAPESATGLQTELRSVEHQSLVVSAHPLATEAGLNILKQGGTAAAAAVAVQAMLTLVEPQSSGIGG